MKPITHKESFFVSLIKVTLRQFWLDKADRALVREFLIELTNLLLWLLVRVVIIITFPVSLPLLAYIERLNEAYNEHNMAIPGTTRFKYKSFWVEGLKWVVLITVIVFITWAIFFRY